MPRYKYLSPEDETVFLKALAQVWDAVAYDCLASTALEKGIKEKPVGDGYRLAPAEQVTMPRSHVICIATDQFCTWSIHDWGSRPIMPAEQYKRIREWMHSTPGHIVDKVVKKAFPYRRYGA